MNIWKKLVSIDILTKAHIDTAVDRLGMEFLEVGDDFIRGRVPVDKRTQQPYGLLHGGVSVVLAETLGSCGAMYAAPEGHKAVGLESFLGRRLTGDVERLHDGRGSHSTGRDDPAGPLKLRGRRQE